MYCVCLYVDWYNRQIRMDLNTKHDQTGNQFINFHRMPKRYTTIQYYYYYYGMVVMNWGAMDKE